MFTQVCTMYDEFRIRSVKIKLAPMQATAVPSGQLSIATCWDRNGKYVARTWTNAGQFGYKTEQDGPQIATYSSFSNKPLLQYQSGVIHKSLAAAGFPDNLWMPTSIQ